MRVARVHNKVAGGKRSSTAIVSKASQRNIRLRIRHRRWELWGGRIHPHHSFGCGGNETDTEHQKKHALEGYVYTCSISEL